MRKHLATLLLLCAACGDRDVERVPPEVLAARREAVRTACISGELLASAREDVTTLESSVPPDDGGIARMAHLAALQYAHAYEQHATLRATNAALVDSAANHSPTGADSARHAEAASRIAIRLPQPGTVEANVLDSYQRDFLAVYADADHPCNWDVPADEALDG